MKTSTAVVLILAQVAGVWLSALALLAGVGLGEKLVADGAPAWMPPLCISIAFAFLICSGVSWKLAAKKRDALALLATSLPYIYGTVIVEIIGQ